MGNPRLRDLARAYAQGRIGQAEYRARRSALLDELVRADDTAFDTRPDETRPGARPPAPRTDSPPTAPAPRRSGSGAGKAVLALVVLAALAGGGVYAVRSGLLSAGPAAPPQAPPAAKPTAPTPAPTPAADPVARFLAEPNWDIARLERFLAEWRALPAPERARLERSPSFQYLADAIYRRRSEQTALADLGSADAKDQARRLGAVLAAIGLDPDHR